MEQENVHTFRLKRKIKDLLSQWMTVIIPTIYSSGPTIAGIASLFTKVPEFVMMKTFVIFIYESMP